MRPFFIGARCSRVTGELTGHFLALDARIGEVLYRSELPLIAGEITYAVNGKQHVAIASGSAAGF